MTEYADAAHRYRLDSRIATGGMGVVWRATDTRLDRQVAVKVLKPEYADDPQFRARFETEARNAAALHHPGIAGVYDYASDGAAGAAPYLVMELVDGQPLSALLAQARTAGRTLDPEVVRDLMAQTATALAVAHDAGIVHRDIKPANLMVTPERDVKVTDFGIARAGDSAQITRTGAVMGTPQYLAPEQARGNAATPATDVYSLGVVAFECLAGRRPFEADTPVATALAHLQQPVPDLPGTVPSDLAAVVRKALAKDPSDRFTDGAAFAAALRDPSAAGMLPDSTEPTAVIGTGTAVVPPVGGAAPQVERLEPASSYSPEPAPAREERRRRSFPWLPVLAVLLAVALAVVIAFLVFGGDDEEPSADAPSTSASSSTSQDGPETVRLDPDDYVGQPFSVVEAELRALGLSVEPSEVANDGSGEEGIVTEIAPSGRVRVGDVVTVSFWGAVPETSAPPTSSEPTTTPPTSTPPTTSSAPSSSATTESSTPSDSLSPVDGTDGADGARSGPGADW